MLEPFTKLGRIVRLGLPLGHQGKTKICVPANTIKNPNVNMAQAPSFFCTEIVGPCKMTQISRINCEHCLLARVLCTVRLYSRSSIGSCEWACTLNCFATSTGLCMRSPTCDRTSFPSGGTRTCRSCPRRTSKRGTCLLNA